MNFCYRYSDGTFVEARSPLNLSSETYDAAFAKAGYFPQLHKSESVSVYQHINGSNGEPQFLVDLWGDESQIALLVVDDLNHLLATLAAVEPVARYSFRS